MKSRKERTLRKAGEKGRGKEEGWRREGGGNEEGRGRKEEGLRGGQLERQGEGRKRQAEGDMKWKVEKNKRQGELKAGKE